MSTLCKPQTTDNKRRGVFAKQKLLRNPLCGLQAAILAAVIAFTTVACDDFFGGGGGGSWPGSTVDNPLLKKTAVTIDAANWNALLAEIEAAGKYVTLDLSACPMSGVTFDPDITNPEGKRYIVNLTLPDAAERVVGGVYPDAVFKNFDNLTSVTGNGITDIGMYTFNAHTSLSVVNFPNAENIGEGAFTGCTSLSVMNIPNAENIREGAFQDCTSLSVVNFPNAKYIAWSAFTGCTSLTGVNFPNAKIIGDNVFQDCTSLEEITIGATCMIMAFDPITQGFADAYNAAGQAAGTYRKSGTTWILQQ